MACNVVRLIVVSAGQRPTTGESEREISSIDPRDKFKKEEKQQREILCINASVTQKYGDLKRVCDISFILTGQACTGRTASIKTAC